MRDSVIKKVWHPPQRLPRNRRGWWFLPSGLSVSKPDLETDDGFPPLTTRTRSLLFILLYLLSALLTNWHQRSLLISAGFLPQECWGAVRNSERCVTCNIWQMKMLALDSRGLDLGSSVGSSGWRVKREEERRSLKMTCLELLKSIHDVD